ALAAIAELWEGDSHVLFLYALQRQPKSRVASRAGIAALEVPAPVLPPAKADRAVRHHEMAARLIERHHLPLRIVLLAEAPIEVGRPEGALGDPVLAGWPQPYQQRQVGIAATVVIEVLGTTAEMELLHDDVAHREGKRGIRAGLRREPEVCEFHVFRVVWGDRNHLRPAVANRRVEMRIRRARL